MVDRGPLVGKTLKGKYLLQSLLGSGGMADVYLARNVMADRTVALKLLHKALRENKEVVRRFMREAKAANRVRHPCIVDVLDVDADPEAGIFIVQEYLKGETLTERLRRAGGRLSVDEALDLFILLCDACGAAHAGGVTHRDLKPDNVMLIASDAGKTTPKLLDFGVSKISAEADIKSRIGGPTPTDVDLTATGLVMGTPRYMAPEQLIDSSSADARSDVWSLGVMLYQVLSGHKPFRAKKLGELVKQICSGDVTPLQQAAPDLPADVVAIVTRCLRGEPVRRYQNAGELCDALRTVRASFTELQSGVFYQLGDLAAAGDLAAEDTIRFALEDEFDDSLPERRGLPSLSGDDVPPSRRSAPRVGVVGDALPLPDLQFQRSEPEPRSSGGLMKYVLSGIIAVVVIAVVVVVVRRESDDPSETRPPVAAATASPSAHQDRAERSCEVERGRIRSGAPLGALTEGWLVEMWLAGDDNAALQKAPPLAALSSGAPELGERAGEIVVAPSDDGVRVSFRGAQVAAFFSSEGRKGYLSLAERIVTETPVRFAALYARCEHLTFRDIGAWYWGKDKAAATAALLWGSGGYLEPPAFDTSGTSATKLATRLAELDDEATGDIFRKQGADLRLSDSGTALQFPFGGPTRAARASRKLSQLVKP